MNSIHSRRGTRVYRFGEEFRCSQNAVLHPNSSPMLFADALRRCSSVILQDLVAVFFDDTTTLSPALSGPVRPHNGSIRANGAYRTSRHPSWTNKSTLSNLSPQWTLLNTDGWPPLIGPRRFEIQKCFWGCTQAAFKRRSSKIENVRLQAK